MKFLIFADPHWSSYSSIVRSRGTKYSTRLHNLIDTMNWIERTAEANQCDQIICLGDFFDKSELNSEEVSALNEVKWSGLPHWFIVGNHEMGRSTLEFSSSHIFGLNLDFQVVDKPTVYSFCDTSIVFLPYILENNRQPLTEYLKDFKLNDNTIIMSHNDIAGMQMGTFISKDGFSIEEIEQSCSLFINGHLHNGSQIGKNIINVGNITGQNFSEDAFQYKHQALLLDTSVRSIQWLENPYSLKFYKLDLMNMRPHYDDKEIQDTLSSLAAPAIVTVKVTPECVFVAKDLVSASNNILEARIIVDTTQSSTSSSVKYEATSIDHISKFSEYVTQMIANSELLREELEKVLQ